MSRLNLLGQHFGELTVIDVSDKRGSSGEVYWLAKCVCGNKKEVRASSLTGGKTKSCGCYAFRNQNLSGTKYGKWTVLSSEIIRENRLRYLECQCVCGLVKKIKTNVLFNGKTLSCQNCRSTNQQQIFDNSLAAKEVWRGYKVKANKKHLEFQMTFAEFYKLSQQDCFYCKASPSNCRKAPKENTLPFIYNGVDRVNSSKGYITENIVTCCWTCNSNKRADDVDNWYAWIKKVYEHGVEQGRIV